MKNLQNILLEKMFFLPHFWKLMFTGITSMIKIKMKMFCKRMSCDASSSHKTFLRLGNVITLNSERKFKILHYWSYKHYCVVACCLCLVQSEYILLFFNVNIVKSLFIFNSVSQKPIYYMKIMWKKKLEWQYICSVIITELINFVVFSLWSINTCTFYYLLAVDF